MSLFVKFLRCVCMIINTSKYNNNNLSPFILADIVPSAPETVSFQLNPGADNRDLAFECVMSGLSEATAYYHVSWYLNGTYGQP